MTINRRTFLKNAGIVAAGVGLNPILRVNAASQNIEWWNPHGSPAFMETWDTLLAELQEETGIEVTNSIVGWGDLVPKGTQASISNTLPDVITGGSGFPQIFAEMGGLQDVSDTLALIEQAGSTVSAKAVLGASHNGKPYGIPRYIATNGITYRGDLFEQAGIDAPDYAFGWEEFTEVCERLNNPPDRYALAAAGTTFDAEKVIWNVLASNEATILDADGKLIWESDETVEAYRFLSDILRRFAPPGVSGYDLADANRAYITGKAAMTYGDGDVNMEVDSQKPEWIPSTGFMSSPVSKIRANYGGVVTFMLPKGDHFKQASRFAEFMLRPDNLVRAIWPFRTLVTPATDTAHGSQLLQSDPTFQKWAGVLAQLAAVAQNASGVAAYHGVLPASGLIEGSGILSKTMQKILVNNMDPEQAVSEATPDLEDVLRG